MKILVLNQDWFVPELREAGHTVATCGFAENMEFRIEVPLVHIDNLIRYVGFEPDRILVHDNSSPIGVTGLEESQVPVVFYSVDTHHHWELHRELYNLVDLMLVAQRDYLPKFEELGHHPLWLPLWASRYVEPIPHKAYGAVFVGTLNRKLNPQRVEFFELLQQRCPLLCTSGDWASIFATSQLVVNQTVRGDLNFRVFEAMMSGALLLTERSGNGLLELFRDGEHLITYEKHSVDEAAEKIRSALADPATAARIAQQGRDEVLRAHLPVHRAQYLLTLLERVEKRSSSTRFIAAMANYASLGITMERLKMHGPARAYLAAVRALEQSLDHNEEVREALAAVAVFACARYESYMTSGAGDAILHRLAERFPQLPIFGLARVRSHLNRGEFAEAERWARRVCSDVPPSSLFHTAEAVIRRVIQELSGRQADLNPSSES